MKNITIGLIVVQILSMISSVLVRAAEAPNKNFIVTAYYSPLPDQSFYLKGSYEADIRLNGNGTHGASGKEVYVGMLAGPKTYAFGTKVYLEGLGIGTVDDRGGAIVSSGSRGYDADRLDIWMGQGEEGLRRALSWGKRRVTGKIIDQQDEMARENIDLSQIKIAKMNTKAYVIEQKQKISKVEQVLGIFTSVVTKNSSPERIKELQKILSDLSYYDDDIDGKYSSILEDAIADFQIENQLIPSKKNIASGFYGVKTRAKLQKIYTLYTENEQKRVAEEAKIAQEKVAEEARLALVKAKQQKQEEAHKMEVALFVKNLGTPKADEIGVHVRKLQQSLKALGYFNGKDTAIFGKMTQSALIQYQTDKKISSDELGKLGKSTKEALFRDLLSSKTNKDDSKKEDV